MAFAESVSLDPLIAGGPQPKQRSVALASLPDAPPLTRGRREPKVPRRASTKAGGQTRATRLSRPTAEPAAARTSPPPPLPEPTAADIRVRAYEIYLGRGDAPGDALSDWLQAEQELWAEHRAAELARLAAAASAKPARR